MNPNQTTVNQSESSISQSDQQTLSHLGQPFTLLLACAGFIGVAGLHRIYTGKYLSGIVMFLTLGGGVIWTVIDIVYILVGYFQDAHGMPIRRVMQEEDKPIDTTP